MEQFEPVIVAFCCHYCAYTAADMAGSQRLVYPANVKIIRVPCSGKVDSLHIAKAFEKGADGVFVAGCLAGDCHFKNGNEKAAKKVAYMEDYLEEIGIEPERLEMVRVSAGMGTKFAQITTEITEKIRKLGPSPIKAVKA
jgi:coenzyme F420-reducing hydrogenase delta subunit